MSDVVTLTIQHVNIVALTIRHASDVALPMRHASEVALTLRHDIDVTLTIRHASDVALTIRHASDVTLTTRYNKPSSENKLRNVNCSQSSRKGQLERSLIRCVALRPAVTSCNGILSAPVALSTITFANCYKQRTFWATEAVAVAAAAAAADFWSVYT